MTLFDLEKTSMFTKQSDFARWVTFGFNEELVTSIIPSIMDNSQLPLFILIIKNKHLLSQTSESIENFLMRVDSLEEMDRGVEVLKLYTKSGKHLLNSDTLLSTSTSFVSQNEIDYTIRSHRFQMSVYNRDLFGFINEDLKTDIIACKDYIRQCIQDKSDVESITDTTVTMINGRVFKLHVID